MEGKKNQRNRNGNMIRGLERAETKERTMGTAEKKTVVVFVSRNVVSDTANAIFAAIPIWF